MANLTLALSPNPILKMKSLPVDKVDKNLQHFLDDMLETMYYQEGAGLAAVQVGVLKRIFVLDINKNEENHLRNPLFFINPEIIYTSEKQSQYNEGCLSFPGARAMLSRPEVVKIRYLDYDGNQKEMEADGYMARGFLHENDHLDGITMPDHLSAMKRDVFLRHVRKYIRNHNDK